MLPLPEAIILVLAPFAPLVLHRVWLHTQPWLLGALLLASGAHTVTASLRAMGLAMERRFTTYPRVLNRATWSARQDSQMLLGFLITCLVPLGATMGFGADDTVERRGDCQVVAQRCYRDAVRSTNKHIMRNVGLKWVSMQPLVLSRLQLEFGESQDVRVRELRDWLAPLGLRTEP